MRNFMNQGTGTSIDVAIQDQTTEIVSLYLTRNIDNIILTEDLTVEDTSITFTCDTLPVAGNTVCLREYSKFFQADILSVAGDNPYTCVLDSPLDYAYTIAATGHVSTKHLNVNGSLASPIYFTVSPVGLNPGTKWDITRVLITMECASTPDSLKFGDLTKLTNGVILRFEDGFTKNIFNAKSNGEIADRSFDIAYDDRASGASKWFFRARRTFSGLDQNGVVIRLHSNTEDTVKMIIQDNLTSLTDFRVVVQGHKVDD